MWRAWLCCSWLWGGLYVEGAAEQESIQAVVCISIVQWPQLSTGLVSEACVAKSQEGEICQGRQRRTGTSRAPSLVY